MKKNGKIPPHFLYFLENEGIEIVESRSSNLMQKDLYDKILVKFPYSMKTLHIQIIFDNLDYSNPPDFILIKENNLCIDYSEVINHWNFKESSTLYIALKKIKEKYSQEQEKILLEELKDLNLFNSSLSPHEAYDNDLEIVNLLDTIGDIIKTVKTKIKSYKNIKDASIEYTLNYGEHINSPSNEELKENYRNYVIVTYPLDMIIRSRNISKYPIINICIPINKEGKFFIEVKTPNYVSISDFVFNSEGYQLKSFKESLNKIEQNLTSYFKDMQMKEKVFSKIIESNIGYLLELDTFSFNKLTLYFHSNKNITTQNSSLTSNARSPSKNTPTGKGTQNLILHFIFSKEDNKLELQIINSDVLRLVTKTKMDYGVEDKQINNILHKTIQTILDNLP